MNPLTKDNVNKIVPTNNNLNRIFSTAIKGGNEECRSEAFFSLRRKFIYDNCTAYNEAIAKTEYANNAKLIWISKFGLMLILSIFIFQV